MGRKIVLKKLDKQFGLTKYVQKRLKKLRGLIFRTKVCLKYGQKNQWKRRVEQLAEKFCGYLGGKIGQQIGVKICNGNYFLTNWVDKLGDKNNC